MAGIPIYLDRLINPEAARKLASVGLDKVAAEMLKAEGYKVGSELAVRDVIGALGTKLRQKNAEYARIAEGLQALATLNKTSAISNPFHKKTMLEKATDTAKRVSKITPKDVDDFAGKAGKKVDDVFEKIRKY